MYRDGADLISSNHVTKHTIRTPQKHTNHDTVNPFSAGPVRVPNFLHTPTSVAAVADLSAKKQVSSKGYLQSTASSTFRRYYVSYSSFSS